MLGEYHRALGRLVHALRGHPRAVHRRRGHGVLQRSRPVRRRRRARRRDGAGDPRRGQRAGRAAGGAAAIDLALGHGHRPGLRDPRPDRVRGPLRLRRHRQRHQPGRAAVLRRRRLAGAGHRPRARRRRAPGRAPRPVGDLRAQGIQPDGAGPQHLRDERGEDSHDTTAGRRPDTVRARRRRTLPALRRAAAVDAAGVGLDAPRPRRRVRRRGALGQPRRAPPSAAAP